MPRMFDFDPHPYAARFAAQGYVHIPRALTEEFFQVLRGQIDEQQRVHVLKEFALGGKEQSLYQFPDGSDHVAELFATVAAVCGVDPRSLVLSERHIKAYQPDALPNPLAHKDRLATEIAVGFSIRVAKESALVFYPNDDVSVNPFNASAELRASLREERLPEHTLEHARRVEIHDSPRDVVMFRGNAIWHLRSKPAATTMLYLKMNTFNCDPLGEDPSTADQEHRTRLLLSVPDGAFENLVPLVARRVDHVHRRYDRDWNEILGVVLWGQRHLTVDELDLRALRAMDGRRNVRGLIAAMPEHVDAAAMMARLRRLAARGIIDLALPRDTPHAAAPQTDAGRVASNTGFAVYSPAVPMPSTNPQ